MSGAVPLLICLLCLAAVGAAVAAVFAAVNVTGGDGVLSSEPVFVTAPAEQLRPKVSTVVPGATLGRTYKAVAEADASVTYLYTMLANPEFVPGTGQALRVSVSSQKVIKTVGIRS